MFRPIPSVGRHIGNVEPIFHGPTPAAARRSGTPVRGDREDPIVSWHTLPVFASSNAVSSQLPDEPLSKWLFDHSAAILLIMAVRTEIAQCRTERSLNATAFYHKQSAWRQESVSYLRRGRHRSRFTRGKSCNDSIMDQSQSSQTKLDACPCRATDARIDDFTTVRRSLKGRREAGPTARTARQTN